MASLVAIVLALVLLASVCEPNAEDEGHTRRALALPESQRGPEGTSGREPEPADRST